MEAAMRSSGGLRAVPSVMAPLTVFLPDSTRYKEILVADAMNPRSWRVVALDRSERSLADETVSMQFFEDLVSSMNRPLQAVYLSVEQDEAGRHLFLNLDD